MHKFNMALPDDCDTNLQGLHENDDFHVEKLQDTQTQQDHLSAYIHVHIN